MSRQPRSPRTSPDLGAFAPEPAADDAAPRVALYEDDEVLGEIIAACLRAHGLRLLPLLPPSDEVLELLLRVWRPDLLVLDLDVSRPNAVELLRRLRRRVAGAATPVLAIVLPGQVDLERKARSLGVDQILRRPFRPLELVSAVERSLAVDGTVQGPP